MKEYPLDYRPGSIPSPIEAIPFFQTLSPEIIEGMMASTRILDCEPGDLIIEDGARESDLIFLLKGRVRIQKDGTIIGAASEAGNLLGEISLLKEDHQRTASIVAETQAYCLKVSPDFLDSLSPEARNACYAAVYRFLAELLAERLESTSQKLVRAEQMLSESRDGGL